MQERDFCYWLKGFMEIQNPTTLDKDQIQIIQDHLDLVFDKVTPVRTPKVTPYIPTPISPTTPSTYPGLFPKTYPDPIINPSPSNPWDQSPTIYCSTGDSPKLCSEDFSSMLKESVAEPSLFKKGPSKRVKIGGGGSKIVC